MYIRPSSALRNEYNEIAKICKEQRVPVYLTINGREDTVLMSVDEYERLERAELLCRLQELESDIKENKTVPVETVFAELRNKLKAIKG